MRDIDKQLIASVIRSNVIDEFQNIKNLLEKGANPNIQDEDNKEFHYFIDFAISLNNKEVNETNILGNTPLHWAVIVNSPKVIKLLLDKGANPNIKNTIGMVALHWVFKEENTNLLIPKFLIENGANPNIQDEELYTPLNFATYFNRNLETIKQLFIKNNIDVNITNNSNFSPLHYAAERNNFNLVKFLLENGANPNIKGGSDWQPLLPIDLCKNEAIKQLLHNSKIIVESKINRTGRQKFRKKIIEKYEECIFTGISDQSLLIASHIKPWSVCNDVERNDINNGLLLSTKYDDLFDKGLITFDEKGKLLINSFLSKQKIQELNLQQDKCYKEKIQMNNEQQKYLEYHRNNIFNKKEQEQKIVNLESKIEKKRMQKMFCSEKEKINLNLEINNMLKEIQNLKINFNLLEINSIDLQNEPSTSGYKPSSPKM